MKLDAIGMREAADWAASLRQRGGDEQYLVATFDAESQDYTFTVEAEPDAPEDAVVIPCNTADVQPNRPGVRAVEMAASWAPGSATFRTSLMRYDAVFWSEAAVEKFLFPYYASKYQWAAAEVLSQLAEVFYGYVPGFTNRPGVQSDPLIPFAMAHLPRSDYVPEEMNAQGAAGPTADAAGVNGSGPPVPPGPMRDLWVLAVDHDGNISHHALADFIAVRQRARARAQAPG
ncbi:MAG TPA: hypothetical protein VK358_09030 [Longimicrobium sp.]|nr:hypothetical protein [Longimicrobium sp.]